MKVTLTYNLPDELDIYKLALQNKYKHNANETICPVEESALKELYTTIMKYMLKPSNDNLFTLNKILEKYSKYA